MTAIGFVLIVVFGLIWFVAIAGDIDEKALLVGVLGTFVGIIFASIGIAMWLWKVMP